MGAKCSESLVYIYSVLLVCFPVLVCLYAIDVKTIEPIGPNFFVGPDMIPEKVYGCSEFKNMALTNLIYLNPEFPLDEVS